MDLGGEKVERSGWTSFSRSSRRNMIRELPHWTTEICQVTLGSGVVGAGETMVFYTRGNTTDQVGLTRG
ncbi:MAG: hypothetical protein U1D30_01875 [Planctomycetota bacterium]